MNEALLIRGSAVLGALTGIVSTSWKQRKDLEAQYDIDLRKRRIGVYHELWKRLEPLAFFAVPTPTYTVVAGLTKELRQWYFHKGGLFLSERTREPYFDVQEALKGILEQPRTSDENGLDEASLKLLKALASRLRS